VVVVTGEGKGCSRQIGTAEYLSDLIFVLDLTEPEDTTYPGCN